MQQALKIAREALLEQTGLVTGDLENVMSLLQGHNIDLADIYLQSTRYESWGLEDGHVKEGSHSIDQGAGIRAISGEKTGFAYSDEISFEALTQAAKNARSIAKAGQSPTYSSGSFRETSPLYLPNDPLLSLDENEKIDLLKRLDGECRSLDPRIEQVFISLSGSHEVVLVMTQNGTIHADVRPLVRLNINVLAESKGRREQGSAGGGGRVDYKYFLETNRASEYAQEAVRQALVNLDAREAPAGNMTVVLGSGWPGILLHEAIGHGLEGDFNRKGTSAFAGRLGEKVASPLCTVVDDGTLMGRRGSLSIDDEGTPTACTTLIESGILKGYMQDLHNAHLMGVSPTGNGRRESYQHLPMPRMTNTYMLAGPHEPEEIIRSVSKGLYAKNFGGGQVDITSGKFVFSASEAYLIENGKITSPVKGATLIGNGPDVLTRVSMVGNDLALDPGIGSCGKDGQSVPVGVGQPTLRVDGLTVGGTRLSN